MNLEQLQARHIPFHSLRSTTEAFIDYAIEECSPKFNYALIGSGVSQNPNQPVSLRDLHGFQLGGVSLPHGKVNPPHMHFTCEVFECTRGDWKLMWGFNPEPEQALLGEGDIGVHFPPSDPQWKGAESHIFLRHAMGLVAERGYALANCDVTLVCERPKIGPHAEAMRAALAAIMGVEMERISVKATTSERLGFTGREEGIAALATAALVRA